MSWKGGKRGMGYENKPGTQEYRFLMCKILGIKYL